MKAFPIDADTASIERWQGMDLRDYFASKVMNEFTFSRPRYGKEDTDYVLRDALRCYEIADAMMKARKNEAH